MQTRKLGFRGLTLALASVLTLGLAACEDSENAPVVQPVVLTISPTGTVDLQVGQTFQVVASVQNATNAAINYTSSNTAVATVGANGTVTAVAPGVATITATSAQDPNARAAVVVRVTSPVGPPQPVQDSADVVIEAIVNAANLPVAETNVQGTIFVRLDVTPGRADSLKVFVGQTEACRQVFGAAAASQAAAGVNAAAATAEFVCSINTAAATAGNPRYPNGTAVLSARLYDNNVVIDQASRTITLANVNQLNPVISADTSAIGTAGLLWYDGSVTVTLNPVAFTGGSANVARVTVQAYNDRTDAVVATRTDETVENGAFSVTFPTTGSSSLGTLTTDSLIFRINAVTVGGQEFGPTQSTAPIRYDNVMPVLAAGATATGFTATGNFFVGSSFAFNSGAVGGTTTELFEGAEDVMPGSGVDGVTFAFIANNAANAAVTTTASQSTLATAFNSGTVVTTGADVPASTQNTAYTLLARVRDEVGNVTYYRYAGQFGADPNAPTVAFVSGTVPNNAINPAGPIAVAITEDISGPAANPIQVQAIRTTPAGQTCYNVATQAVVTTPSSGVCPFISLPTTSVPVPTTEGYYQLNIRAVDAAGNVSAVTSRFILVDFTAPSAAITSVTTAETTVSVTGTLIDNIDLDEYNAYLRFNGTTFLGASLLYPFAQDVNVSDFGLPADGTASASATVPFIRGLQVTDASGVPTTILPVNAATLGGYDVAQNFGLATTASTIASPTASNGAPADLGTFAVTNTALTICRPGSTNTSCTGTSAIPSSRTLTAVATSTAGAQGTFQAPFTTVYFYIVESSGALKLIGMGSSPTVQTTTTERFYTYSATLSGSEFNAAGAANIIAVGVDAQRDALQANAVVFDVR